jgi:hypothetical protein
MESVFGDVIDASNEGHAGKKMTIFARSGVIRSLGKSY